MSLCNKPVCVPTQKITSLWNVSHHSHLMLHFPLPFFLLFSASLSHHTLSSGIMGFFFLFLLGWKKTVVLFSVAFWKHWTDCHFRSTEVKSNRGIYFISTFFFVPVSWYHPPRLSTFMQIRKKKKKSKGCLYRCSPRRSEAKIDVLKQKKEIGAPLLIKSFWMCTLYLHEGTGCGLWGGCRPMVCGVAVKGKVLGLKGVGALYDLWYTHNPKRDRSRVWL